ncbi:MAG: hypothetical protein JF616_12315 [Fibrobacteres bacterium]|nr:hypothetical protein [Fibrobacterota bacterium]
MASDRGLVSVRRLGLLALTGMFFACASAPNGGKTTYTVLQAPTPHLGTFGSITLGTVSGAGDGTTTEDSYLAGAAEANAEMTKALGLRLPGVFTTPNGPPLVMTADLVRFARSASFMSKWNAHVSDPGTPKNYGAGHIRYRVSLSSNGALVAQYEVMKAASAYDAEADMIVKFLNDYK